MALNENQQKAVEYLDGPLLVLAGPGTGKTQLLSSKVAYILKNVDGVNPENILCLTFTEAGASNMRERLLSIVGPEASGVNIHTYHAFGSDILGQYKNYAEHFTRNLDEPIDTVTQYKIINNIIDNLPMTDILKTNETKDIIATISEAKSACLTADDLHKIAEQNIVDSENLIVEINEVLKQIIPRMKFDEALPIYQEAGNVIAKYTSIDPIVNNIERESNTLLRNLQSTIEDEQAKEKPSVSPLTAWRNKFFEKDKNNNFRLKNFIKNKKLLSLSNVMGQYEKYLDENNLFDFSDMIQQAVKVLKEDDGFRYTLQERYQYILLDEYQDTNPAQFSLVDLLVNKENTFVMAVGDDDQAIYEFQGASASNLTDYQQKYNAEVINLTENYRSTTEILDISRKVAAQIETSFAKVHNYNKILTSVRNDDILAGETNPCVIRHEFKASDAEYSWIANRINELIKSGEKQSNIAILTRKHKYIAPLLPYLKAHENINIAYEKRENVLEDENIKQIITLSRFIHEVASGRDPRHMLLEILTFPFFEVSALESITALRSYYGDTRGAFDYLQKSENKKLIFIAEFLSELVAKSFDTPLELFIDYMIGSTDIKEGLRSPFLNYYSGDINEYRTYNLYENLSVLRENIKHHVKSEKPRLSDFIAFLEDYEIAGQAILNTSPYQDSSDSVQIMSAHSSKGLEFKHVFIISADDKSWGNGGGNNNKLSLPANLECIRHTGVTDDECLRLFFVALTRAEKTITLTNSKQDFSGKTVNRLQYLMEAEDPETKKIISPLLLAKEVIEHNEDISVTEHKENIEKHWIANYMNPTPDLKPVLLESVKNFNMNASALTKFIDVNFGGPIEFYRTYIINGPSDPGSYSTELGTFVHEAFQAITCENITEEEAINRFIESINKSDFTDEEKEDLINTGKISIHETLKAYGSVIAPKEEHIKAKAEVSFWSEHLNYEGIPLTGKIDHFNINEEEKTIEIYDFKTSAYHDKDWMKDTTLYKYALQLMLYKLLLNLSPTYNKYKVTKAHILFVKPSAKDLEYSRTNTEIELIHDKVFDFTDADEDEMKSLMKAVYKHIQMLDFTDENSPLAIQPDRSKKMQDLLDFCELVKETAK